MKYTTEKILLAILAFEIIAAIFIGCFCYDLYQATINGKTKLNEYGQVTHTPMQSWSVSLMENLNEIRGQ